MRSFAFARHNKKMWGSSIVLTVLLIIAMLLFVVPNNARAVGACPCAIFDGATPTYTAYNNHSAITLGVRFRPIVSGYITGVQFYKDPSMTDTHKGSLWDATGNQLATGTFTGETASGWQVLTFATPVAVTADTTYTASYTTSGGYIASSNYFTSTPVSNFPLRTLANNEFDAAGHSGNGVFSNSDNTYPTQSFNSTNYWVDVKFIGAADATPAITAQSPTSAASGVGIGAPVTISFNTNLDNSSLNASTVQLTDPSNNPVSSTISFNYVTNVLTVTPTSRLNLSTTYTVKLIGGTNGIKSFNGTPMGGDTSWHFTTESSISGPYSVYNKQVLPDSASSSSEVAVELGTQLHSDTAGYITAIRFYKQLIDMSSSHTVNLWKSDGTLVGSATSTN